MELSTWFLFILVGSVAILSPGPAMLLSVSNSLQYGVRKALLSTLGNISGLFLLSSAAIFGLGAVLKTSTSLFLILKVVGALYLIYLGVKQWRANNHFFGAESGKQQKLKSNKYIYLEGFFIAITNPKAILFFTALFPQFIDLTNPLPQQFLIMTFTFMFMSFIVLSSYAILANKAKKWFSVNKRTTWFNRIVGSLYVFIGMILLSARVERV